MILTQLTSGIGFFAVLPFLAEHLGTALGMAGWMVGFVLGLRTFSQQGLFVVGGALVDLPHSRLRSSGRDPHRRTPDRAGRLRAAGRRIRLAGVRGTDLDGDRAVLLIGFAAALFSPAVESEVARQAVIREEEGHGSRTRVPALLSAAGQAGAFIGPLLGALLLAVDFRTTYLAGAAVFVLVLAGHIWLMPQHIPGRVRPRQRGGTRALLRNRSFLALCCAYGTYLLAYYQLYLALPDEVRRATGSQAALSWLFALSSLLVVCAQLPLAHWAGDRLGLRRSMIAGLLLIASFRGRGRRPARRLTGVAGLLPAAGYVVLLTLGQMLVVPAARAWAPDLAEDGRIGLYTGALSSVSGLIVLIGSSVTGSLLDLDLPAAVPWLILAAVPALAVALLPHHPKKAESTSGADPAASAT
ncbi:putative MFS-type transporter [Streptomyces afghaniensis 772]|uniref:Putative MFS-type transporter n=1 Tax=Streptomyces afghaniensis 772 TaxID=1283301 RepID=S4MJB7_9ACTN|nr:putative MFS-type transporter [Streptomyces afghaniensis 772]